MPLVWSLDDVLIALDRLPGPLRKAAMNTAKATIRNVDLKTNALTVTGAVRAADAAWAAEAQGPAEPPPDVPGHAHRRDGDHDGRRGPAEEDRGAQRHRHGQGPAGRGRRLRRPPRAGPAGGRRASGPAGRRLRGHRGRRPQARRGGHDPDRAGDALGRAQRVVGHRPHDRGLDHLAGHRDPAAHLPHQALALGRSAGRADHRADDAGGQPPGHPLPRRPPPRGGRRRRRPARPSVPSRCRSSGRPSPGPSATGPSSPAISFRSSSSGRSWASARSARRSS